MITKRIICFLGPQGSGKGTQASLLSKDINIPYVSMGDLFRSHIDQETAIGLEAKDYIEQGRYAPDTITNQLLAETLEEPMYTAGIILDGYPRTLKQKEFLDSNFETYEVVYISLTDEESIARIAGRMQCEGGHVYHLKHNPSKTEGVCDIDELPLVRRHDDTPEYLAARLDDYHKKTEPILRALREDKKLIVIEGAASIDTVYEAIKSALVK